MIVKRAVVATMMAACHTLDCLYWLPWPLTRLRCPRGLHLWSSELDQRWGTGLWKPLGVGTEDERAWVDAARRKPGKCKDDRREP